ncbi:MAG TPA: S8 family serine peptidase, partial [Solirubrobacteraceae bacterium]
MNGGLAPRIRAGRVASLAVLALLTLSAPAGAAPRDPRPGFAPLAHDLLATPAGHAPAAARAPRAPRLRARPKPAASAHAAPGRVLVRFRRDATAAARQDALAGASASAGTAVHGTGFVRVRTADTSARAAARELDAEPAVADVVLDYERRAAAAPNDPQFVKGLQDDLRTLRLPAAWDRAKATKDDVVAVLDTGVDLDHPDLAPQLVAGRDVVNRDDRADDDNGHGTAVAGIAAARAGDAVGMAGVAWGAGVMPVKVLDGDGLGWDSDIAEGIAWAADHGADVITVALAAPGRTPLYDDAVAYARAHGALVVAAAGNSPASGQAEWPAAAPAALAVSATDWSGDFAAVSSFGDFVDIAAPGMRMTTAWRAPRGAGEWRALQEGTSYAAAFVAGAALLVRAQNPAWTPAHIEARLQSTSQDAGPPGTDPYYGRGVVDPLAALGGTRRAAVTTAPDGDSTMATARLIEQGAYDGWLVGEGDADWYAIDMPEAGSLMASVWTDDWDYYDGRRLDAVLDFYDAAGRPIAHFDEYGVDDGEQDVWADMPAGRNYVRVSNHAGSRVSSRYGVWIGDSTGVTPLPPFYDGVYAGPERPAASTAIGDVTGDGRPDVLATHVDASGADDHAQLSVVEVDADGRLGAVRSYDAGARPQTVPGDGSTTSSDDMDVTVGDLDGDGTGDAAVAVGRWIGVLRGGTTGLGAVAPVPGSRGAHQVEIADLDRDGRRDLVGRLDGRRADGTPVAGLVAYMQTAGGAFERTPIVNGNFTDVAVGDVD